MLVILNILINYLLTTSTGAKYNTVVGLSRVYFGSLVSMLFACQSDGIRMNTYCHQQYSSLCSLNT